jgi:hypothetical protein
MSESMLMLLLITWLEMETICSLNIVLVRLTGEIKIPVEEAPSGRKATRLKIGNLPDQDQECKCLPSHMVLMISIALDPSTLGPMVSY